MNPSYVKPDPEQLFAELRNEFGHPVYFNSKGDPTQINESFWAHLIARENQIIHEADEERFYLYNSLNGCWERKSTHTLKNALSERIRQAQAEWSSYPTLTRFDTEHNRRDVLSLLRGVADRVEFFVKRPPAIHAGNCMLVFKNGSVIPQSFAPEFRSRNQLTVTYDPEACCPRFIKELLIPALTTEDLAVLKKLFGLLVLGLNRPQRIFILTGPGNTGKTTIGLIAEGLIGPQNCAELRTSQLEGRFELARLVGKTLVFGPDVSANFLMTESAYRLKSIVGGDPLIGERKNSNQDFRFKGDINALITANERLLVKLNGGFDQSAWRRRLCLIDFDREPVTKRIPHFDQVLLAQEGSGILNLAIAGLGDYYRDEDARGDIILDGNQIARVEKLLSESDGVRSFITGELVEADGADLSADELVVAYATYAKAKGWKIARRRTIESQSQDLLLEIWGVPQSHNLERGGKGVRGYRGMRLKRVDESDS